MPPGAQKAPTAAAAETRGTRTPPASPPAPSAGEPALNKTEGSDFTARPPDLRLVIPPGIPNAHIPLSTADGSLTGRPKANLPVVRMLRASRADARDNRLTAVHQRLNAARAHWRAQLDLIERNGPTAWLTKCIKQTDNTIYHLCNHEWEWEREAGPYGERFNVCRICRRTQRGATPRIPEGRLIPELKALLRSEETPCEEHLFHESAAARMTNEALRSITNDGDLTATATCLSCDQRNEAHGTPQRPDESQQQPRKRRRDAAHGTPPQPRPNETRADRATQTEANGLLCRDEIPDEDQIESAVEEAMDTLAGTATGYGCATFLPHDGTWTEDSQRWHEGSPICRSCEDSSYPEACALLFSASTRTRSVAVYADQCRGCRGLYDGIRGFEDGYTEPEDIYSGHPLPLAASEWTQESDIVPPPMEPGKIWERPSFKHGRLCFSDGRAAELAAAAALAASARADAKVFKMRLALNPQMRAAGMAATAAAQAALDAIAMAEKAMRLPIAMNMASWAAAAALSAAAEVARHAEHQSPDATGTPLSPVNTNPTGTATLRMGRVIMEGTSPYTGMEQVVQEPNPWLVKPHAGPARQLMTAAIRGLLHHLHEATAATDLAYPDDAPHAIPTAIMRVLPGDSAAQGNLLALTPYPWMEIESILIERRVAFAAPTLSDYIHWISGHAPCKHPLQKGIIPCGQVLTYYVQEAYWSASIAFHHNAATRRAWLGRTAALSFPMLVATPPAHLGLPLDQGPCNRKVSQCFYLRINHLKTTPGQRAILHQSSSNRQGCPVNAASLRGSLAALPAADQPAISKGSVYRTAHLLLQGLETTGAFNKPADNQTLYICPGTNCTQLRITGTKGNTKCGNISCQTNCPLYCSETLEASTPFAEDATWMANDGPPITWDDLLDHDKILADATPQCELAAKALRELYSLPICRAVNKRDRSVAVIRMNKRRRGPVSRRGTHSPVMTGTITIIVNGRRIKATAFIDTGADVSIVNTRFSTPCSQGNAPTTLRTVSGATAELGKLRAMHIVTSPTDVIGINGHAQTSTTPLEGRACLLGMPAIKALNIDLNTLAFADNKSGPAVITFLPPRKPPQNKSRQITVFDLFCGVGGATIGMERAGWKTTGMIDSDSTCIDVCKTAFPHALVYHADATTRSLRATLKQLKPIVVWSSPPCQPASSLNLHKKPQDTRAAAGVQACSHAIAANAALIIIENVPAYQRTPAFKRTVQLLQDNAYHVDTNVINAAKCGLPQSRRRLIITGFLGTKPLGLREAIIKGSRTPDVTIKSLIPRADHIFFPPRLSRQQPYVISALAKCPCITTKCLGRPGRKLRDCKANSADIGKATILTARDFAKLQGLPDNHPLPFHNQSAAGRLIGNTFPPACAAYIAKAVTPALRHYLELRAQPGTKGEKSRIPAGEIRMGCATNWHRWCQVRDTLEFRQHTPQIKTCRLSESVLRQYLKKHGDDATASIRTLYSIRDMDINKSVENKTKESIYALCEQYPDIWLKDSQELPRAVLGQDGKPFVHKIVFKDNHKPTRCRQPEFPIGSAKRAILEAWTEQGLRSGLLVKAENSLWASRVLTVAKYDLDENRDGVPDNLRIVSDFVQANTQKKPVVPEFAHAHIEMHRVSGYRWYAQLDAAKGYWGFLLDKASSASTAIWLPHNGRTALFRYTRAVMGDQSSGATMNTRFAEALALNVDERARKHLSNMADDWVAFANTIEELLYALDALFKMFDRFHITVNPAKVRLCYNTVTYWGFDFSADGSRPSARNLNPVRKMQVPTTRKELQAALGLFNYFSHYISDLDKSRDPPRLITYSELVAPMQLLVRDSTKTKKQFAALWAADQQKAFDRVKEILLADVMLHAPDYTRPFRMSSDASDHGWGATLFQDKPIPGDTSEPDPEAAPGVPEASKVNVIRMWSKAWTDSQRKLPVYFRESLGWCLGILKCRPYVLSSRFPLITQTDHLPLTWIRKSSGKAAISAFLTSRVADVDWRIYYLPGHLNTLADAVSRPPFLGPLRPDTTGLHEMVKTLLLHLAPANKMCKHPWVYASRDTTRLAKQLQSWRSEKNPVKKFSCSPKNIESNTWDLAIVIPVAENAGTVAYNLLKKGAPAACLLPSSLLHRVPQNMDGSYDKLVTQRVANAGKICFASAEYIWLVHDEAHPAVHRVYKAIADHGPYIQYLHHCRMACSATEIGNASTWSYKATNAERQAATKQGLQILQDENGPQYVSNTDDPSNRVIVPPNKRQALIDLTHKQSHHLGWAMNWSHLKPTFWWPTMQADIKKRVNTCPQCKLAKGTRRSAHTHWRGKPNSMPRTAWSFDFKGMPTSSNGSNEIAGAVDFATHKLILIPLPNRKAAVAAEAIMEHICFREGTPLVFHSDSAAELKSRIMTNLWQLQGTKATQTLGHNPTGNSLVERTWRFVNAALRCLTDAQYKSWHRHLPGMAAAWNSTPCSTLGVSPFEASCGLPLRTPVTAIAAKQPTKPSSMRTSDITMLHKAAASFRKIASKNQEWNRTREAKLLNKHGRWKYLCKLGDLVKIFIPPTANEATRRGRKVKHCFWYRGPAKVVKILSQTTFTVQMCRDKRLYDRSISNISPWGKPNPKDRNMTLESTPPRPNGPTIEASPASTNVYDKGDLIAVKDDASEDTYWLADVTRVRGDDLTLAYYGTNGRALRTARFRPMLTTTKNELTFKKAKGTKRWTGVMPVHTLPGCVMGRKLKLTNGGTLSSASIQVLTSLVNTLSHALVDKPTQ